jgi:hypothetical protein
MPSARRCSNSFWLISPNQLVSGPTSASCCNSTMPAGTDRRTCVRKLNHVERHCRPPVRGCNFPALLGANRSSARSVQVEGRAAHPRPATRFHRVLAAACRPHHLEKFLKLPLIEPRVVHCQVSAGLLACRDEIKLAVLNAFIASTSIRFPADCVSPSMVWLVEITFREPGLPAAPSLTGEPSREFGR